MAKKLTADEQAMVVSLAKVLAKISYGPVRSNASGIASGLVRLRKDPLPVSDVDSVLGRYGCAGSSARETLVHAGVLVTAADAGAGVEAGAGAGAGSDAEATRAGVVGEVAGAGEAAGVGEAARAGGVGVHEPHHSAACAFYHLALPSLTPSAGKLRARDAALGASLAGSAGAVVARAQHPARAQAASAAVRARGAAGTDGHVRLQAAPRSRAANAPKSQAAGAEAAARRLLGPGPRTLAEVPHEALHTPEATDLRRSILDLDPRLWLNGWLLGWPQAFALYEDQLRSLDRALSGRARLGDGTLTCRELSYQVFGDEKFLEPDGDGRKLLDHMGLRDIVSARPQPHLGMLHHVPRRRSHMRIVVTENLDPWLDIRELMYAAGRRLILGERVDGVVFGNGYLVDDARRLPEFLDSLDCDEVEVLYWGDIDRAGLQIYDRLRRVAEGRFGLRPFAAAYAKMARRAAARFADPLDNEASAQEGVPFDGLDDFCAELPEDVRSYVHDVIAGKRLVPQEILTRHDL